MAPVERPDGGSPAAKLGQGEKLAAIQELDRQARLLEATATGPSFEALVSEGWGAGEEPLPDEETPRRAQR